MNADKEHSGIIATPITESDLTSLIGTFPAPSNTPYAGGTYEVSITIPERYPFQPPKMHFMTKIWHPNVSSVTGAICLDTLSTGWSPVQTIKVALISCQALLESPEPKDPQDGEVAKMMLQQPEEHLAKARQWAVRFAGAPDEPMDMAPFLKAMGVGKGQEPADVYQGFPKPMVDKFLDMGFEANQVIDAFKKTGIFPNGGQPYTPSLHGWEQHVMARLLGE